MSNETRKELAVWTTICTVCGIIPFAVATLVDGGKLGFIATIFEVLAK